MSNEAGVLDEAAEGQDLEPASGQDLCESDQAVQHFGDLDALRRRQVAAELRVLPHEVPDARLQRGAATGQLCVDPPLAYGGDRLDRTEGTYLAWTKVTALARSAGHGSVLPPADALPLRESEAGVPDEAAEGHLLEPASGHDL